MIRNILYSLFLHSLLILLVYFSFNFHQKQEIDQTARIEINFVTQNDNLKSSNDQPSSPQIVHKVPDVKPDIEPKKKVIPKKISKPHKANPIPAKPPIAKPSPVAKKPPTPIVPPKPDIKTTKESVKAPDVKTAKSVQPPKPQITNVKAQDQESDDENDEEDEDQDDSYSFESKKIDGLNLLVREKFNIQSQIKRCYRKALKADTMKNKVTINAHIVIEKDGSINLNDVLIKDFEKYDNPKEPDFHQAVDIVKNALRFCSPLRNLPPDKYEIWRELDLQFDNDVN